MGTPEVANAIESLLKAARECLRWTVAMGPFPKEMAGLGFPAMYGSVAQAPFDTVGDYFRGTRGTMIDMFRRPDKLLEAIDKVTPWMIQMAISAGKASGNPRVFIPLHKGPENFMSLEQFKTFYWPGLRKIMIALIDQGLTPYLLLEGKWGSGRLEVISDIPKGKAIYHFEGVDIYEAKEILGKVVCIKGNVPTSLLVIGTPQEVKDYSKKLIDVLGKDGGFIMDAGAIIDEVKPQNIKAMTDCTKEYGVYH
jgi:uroporphyrinogen-III decarboxylase